MNNFIKQEYCKEFGYGSFNKYNKSDYSNWLEKKLIEARTQVENLTIHSVVSSNNIDYEKAFNLAMNYINDVFNNDPDFYEEENNSWQQLENFKKENNLT